MAFNGVVTADRAVAPSYGLFSVARVQTRSARDEHWIDGYYVETDACGITLQTFPVCAPGEDWVESFSNDGSPFFHVLSFNILATFSCDNSIGINAIDRRDTVVRKLKNATEFAVEQELWAGANASTDPSDNPTDRWLTNAEDVTPGGGAVEPKLALALVEQNFAANNPGVQATVHLSPLMATLLDSELDEDGGKLYTPSGSLVAISRGGDPTVGPATGGDATTHWIYATGPVHVDLGAEELITVSNSEIVNPVTNQVTYVAERPAAVYFDGCSWYGALADATL